MFERLVDIICDKMSESLDNDPGLLNSNKGTRLGDGAQPSQMNCNCWWGWLLFDKGDSRGKIKSKSRISSVNRPTYHHLLMLKDVAFCSLSSYRFFQIFLVCHQQHILSLGVTLLFNSNLSYCRCFPLVSLLGEWRVEWGAKIQLKLWAENQTSCCKLPCGIKLKSDY